MQILSDFKTRFSLITFKPEWRKANGRQQKKSRQMAFYVAGLKHHDGVGFAEDLMSGESVKLVFENDNPFDEHAIAIYARGVQLGFVPASRNHLVTKMIDQQIIVTATILEVFPNRPAWKRVKVKLEMYFS